MHRSANCTGAYHNALLSCCRASSLNSAPCAFIHAYCIHVQVDKPRRGRRIDIMDLFYPKAVSKSGDDLPAMSLKACSFESLPSVGSSP
jgi:hypothetical protein